jgi:hypothetical protein
LSSNTEKLGLLKKDPLTDGNDTFNIQTMLNDNWDKIDQNVATSEEAQAKADEAKNAAINFAKSYGLGNSSKVLVDPDLNTVMTNGFYYASGANKLNAPPASGNGYLIVQQYSTSYTHQIYIPAANGDMYTRINTNGTWSDWEQLETTSGTQKKIEQTFFKTRKSSKDENTATYTVVEKRREDGTLSQRATFINPNAEGLFQNRKHEWFTTDGVTLEKTITTTIIYDADGEFLEEA